MEKNKKKINRKFIGYSSIIDSIQKVRSKNNKNWMDILKLAFASNPKSASKILSSIYKQDKRIGDLVRKLTKY